jgi:AraC-like DNA-binding protein
MDIADGRREGFHGLEISLRSVPGARAVRVVHGHGQVIDQHRHDWACITIPVLGRATEFWDGGEARMEGPCVLVHPAGAYHADRVGHGGLETVSIQFDPQWLSSFGFEFPLKQTLWRTGAADARQLVRIWSQLDTTDSDLARTTASFLHKVVAAEPAPLPAWLKHVRRSLRGTRRVATSRLAAQLGLNPAWLARAYRAAVGEGLQETVRRGRVERAVPLLRRTDLPLAQVAADCGFCDQSHMTRDFRTLISRTPLQVRSERDLLKIR